MGVPKLHIFSVRHTACLNVVEETSVETDCRRFSINQNSILSYCASAKVIVN